MKIPFITLEDFDANQAAVRLENSKILAYIGPTLFLISATVLVSRGVTQGVQLLIASFFIVLYSAILTMFRKNLESIDPKHATLAIYLFMLPVIVVAILSGTVFYPDHQAASIFLYIIVVPILIMDKPYRLILAIICSAFVFCLMSFLAKTQALFYTDLVHMIEFCMASCICSTVVSNIRYRSINKLNVARSASDTHDLSGLLTKHALHERMGIYDDKYVVAIMIDLDDFKFFNDVYGHQTGDQVITAVGEAISETFDPEHCYSYGGDEFLVIMPGADADTCVSALEILRERISKIELNGRLVHPAFSCGYVYGHNENESNLLDMIAHADYRLYQAKAEGKHSAIGSEYDPMLEAAAP